MIHHHLFDHGIIGAHSLAGPVFRKVKTVKKPPSGMVQPKCALCIPSSRSKRPARFVDSPGKQRASLPPLANTLSFDEGLRTFLFLLCRISFHAGALKTAQAPGCGITTPARFHQCQLDNGTFCLIFPAQLHCTGTPRAGRKPIFEPVNRCTVCSGAMPKNGLARSSGAAKLIYR